MNEGASLVSSFESFAWSKLNTLKRAREAEMEAFSGRVEGPVRKKVRTVFNTAQSSFFDALAVLNSAEGTSTGKLWKLCRSWKVNVDGILGHLKKDT